MESQVKRLSSLKNSQAKEFSGKEFRFLKTNQVCQKNQPIETHQAY
jgi:hypothetical protein